MKRIGTHTTTRPTIVVLCGSTKFKKEYIEAVLSEGMSGKIVLSVCMFIHADNIQVTSEQKKKLDELHLRKIDLADEILVINVNGYIGESTTNEVKYARKLGKIIRYLEEVKNDKRT